MKALYAVALASCRDADPALFFPSGETAQGDEALEAEVVGYLREQYCDTCPIRKGCLDHAIANEQFGIWAGTTSKERRSIKARHRKDVDRARFQDSVKFRKDV